MKRILTIVLTAIILTSCGSTTKKLQQGNYDAVIDKTVKRLIRKPNAEDAAEMDRAYRLANERDQERIRFLVAENNPDNYDEVFHRYNMLKERQRKVRTVTPLEIDGKTYSYDYVDYNAEMIAAKKKAAEYFYANGNAVIRQDSCGGTRSQAQAASGNSCSSMQTRSARRPSQRTRSSACSLPTPWRRWVSRAATMW